MNYQNIYNLLIAKAQVREKVNGYKERHHIVPKSLGGSDHKSNLVELTAREHFIAHMCLALIHGGTQWYAVVRMKKQHELKEQKINSWLYEIARIKNGQAASIRLKGKRPHPNTLAAFSALRKGKPLHKNALIAAGIAKRGIPLSESTRTAMSKAKIGIPKTPEHVQAMLFGKVKAKFNRECIKLNNLIDSVFQPSAAGC